MTNNPAFTLVVQYVIINFGSAKINTKIDIAIHLLGKFFYCCQGDEEEHIR